MGLPVLPIIPDAFMVPKPWKRPYAGEIEPGMVFAWEPDFPHARELVVVVSVVMPTSNAERLIFTRALDSEGRTPNKIHFNDESRFREAVVATNFKGQPPMPGSSPVNPVPLSEAFPNTFGASKCELPKLSDPFAVSEKRIDDAMLATGLPEKPGIREVVKAMLRSGSTHINIKQYFLGER